MRKGDSIGAELEAFGIQLRRYRIMNGMTQADFADLIGVSQATLSRWENGSQAPDIKMRRKVHDLIFRKQPKQDHMINNFVRFSLQKRALTNQDYVFLAVSPQMARVIGSTPDELVGYSHQDGMSEEAKRFIPRLIDAGFFRGQVAIGQFAARVHALSGETFCAIEQVFPFFLSDGSVVAMIEIQIIDEGTFASYARSPEKIELIRSFEGALL